MKPQPRSTVPPPSTATSYTIEHITKHPLYGAGDWYRLRLNYPTKVWGNGGPRKIQMQHSMYEDREQVTRYVKRYHPELPEAPDA